MNNLICILFFTDKIIIIIINDFFCLLLFKVILKLAYSQSWVSRPMIHVDCALYKYQTREVADHSLKYVTCRWSEQS